MKKYVLILLFFLTLVIRPITLTAQAAEAAQLALNIAKLNQLRQILKQMYDGYEILTKGYGKVKDLTQGNYSLHEVFLDGLMAVNPAVKNYRKVADIISNQVRIVSEYKSAFNRLKSSGFLNSAELDYIGKVYGNLTDQSLKNLDALLMVVTASKLRMSDAERLQAIDHLYDEGVDQLSFLRAFNNRANVLLLQRQKEQRDIESVRIWQGLK